MAQPHEPLKEGFIACSDCTVVVCSAKRLLILYHIRLWLSMLAPITIYKFDYGCYNLYMSFLFASVLPLLIMVALALNILQFVLTPDIDKRRTAMRRAIAFCVPNNENYESQVKAWSVKRTIFTVVCIAVASRLLTYFIGALVSGTPIFSQQLWCKWDGNHYLKLAELGYGGYLESCSCGENSPIFLVFFPLYPWLVKIFSLVTFGNYYAAALLVSNLCFVFAAIFFYKLVSSFFTRKTSLLALVLLCFAPFSLFFSAPFTESLFLLTTVATTYFSVKKKWWLAGVFGFAAALSRLVGVFIVIVILGFWLTDILKSRKAEINLSLKKEILKIIPCALAPVVGTLVYLLLNYVVAGDAFKFLFYQNNHWHNRFMIFFESLDIQCSQLSSRLASYSAGGDLNDLFIALGVHLSNILPLLFVLSALIGLILNGDRKMQTLSFLLGFSVLVSYSVSWLLSGARYTFAMFPLYIGLAVLAKNRYARDGIIAVFSITYFVSIVLFVLGQVY